jgi:aspartate aminotransferase-like enzyme
MPRNEHLFTCPTLLSPRVPQALARAIPRHRSEKIRAVWRECAAELKDFLKTRADVLMLSCSGWGGMKLAAAERAWLERTAGA